MPAKFLHTADWQMGMKALRAGEKAKEVRALRFSLALRGRTAGPEPVPLFSATLRENQGHETDRSAAAQPRD